MGRLLLALLPALFSAPARAEEGDYGYWLPTDVSTYGHEIDHGFYLMHWVMLVLFVGWTGLVLYCIARFRAKAGVQASYRGAPVKVGIVMAFAMLAFEFGDLFLVSQKTWAKITKDFPAENDSVVVQIVAEQFQWNVQYPGPDGKFGKFDIAKIDAENPIGLDRDDPDAKDDITNVGDLHIPVGKPVIVKLRSKDVIHSFFIPVMRIKRDVVPGLDGRIWMQATRAGKFEIGCAQLCGLGHARMSGQFTVDEPAAFEQWLKENAPPSAAPEPTPEPTPAPRPKKKQGAKK